MIPSIQSNMIGLGLGAGKAAFEKAIESFEGIFISEIVRGLREAFSEELTGGGGGFGKGVFMTMFDQSLSEAITKAGGLGLKDQLESSLHFTEGDNLVNQKGIQGLRGLKAYLDNNT